MQLHPVESSLIQAAGYHEASETLEVVFNSGKTQRYFQVPEDVRLGLLEADSKGGQMGYAVIDCYPYQQVKKGRR